MLIAGIVMVSIGILGLIYFLWTKEIHNNNNNISYELFIFISSGLALVSSVFFLFNAGQIDASQQYYLTQTLPYAPHTYSNGTVIWEKQTK